MDLNDCRQIEAKTVQGGDSTAKQQIVFLVQCTCTQCKETLHIHTAQLVAFTCTFGRSVDMMTTASMFPYISLCLHKMKKICKCVYVHVLTRTLDRVIKSSLYICIHVV